MTAEQLQSVVDLYSEGNSLRAIGRELEIDDKTAKRWLDHALTDGYKPSPKVKKPQKDLPLSEHASKHRADWSEQDCIDELRRIAGMHEGKFLTRNFFRNHSRCSDSTWDRYFGTFKEFRRQAGLELSRSQHQMELHIAKHASKDNLREFNEEKRAYGEKYLRPVNRRFQTMIVLNDIHDVSCDPFYRRVALETIKRVQPDIINLNGDIYDLPEFSKYNVDPRSWDPVPRIRWVHRLLEDIREVCPDCQIDFIEGNHEFRLLRHLSEATPALKAVLADLHGMTIPGLLGLDNYAVNYVSKADLTAFNESDIKQEIQKSYKVYHGMFLTGHFPEHARLGLPGVNGHHHKFQATPHYSEIFGAYTWWQFGSGHMRNATYCDAQKWQVGFGIVDMDIERKYSQVTPIDLTGNVVQVGGLYYERTAEETALV